MAEKRRKHSAEEKVRILRRYLVEKVPVSDLCDKYGLHPTVFHRSQKGFFENGTAAFKRRDDGRSRKLEKENAGLRAKLAQKDEVIYYVRYWSERTDLARTRLVRWVAISRSKYYEWRSRYGKVNEHNAWIPRDFWLKDKLEGQAQ